MLAGLPAAPSDYSPFVDLERAKERQRHVLDRMAASGYITRRGSASASTTRPLGLVARAADRARSRTSIRTSRRTRSTCSKNQFGTKATYEGGLQVDTTLDPRMQKIGQDAVDWGMERASAEGIGAHQAALVAIRPSTGEILAMIGGKGFSLKDQFNRAWQAKRQPGSSFKPYVYTAAIDNGDPPTMMVDDAPISYPMGDGSSWSPEDDDGSYLGEVTLRYALAQSRNIVAVRLAESSASIA